MSECNQCGNEFDETEQASVTCHRCTGRIQRIKESNKPKEKKRSKPLKTEEEKKENRKIGQEKRKRTMEGRISKVSHSKLMDEYLKTRKIGDRFADVMKKKGIKTIVQDQ